MNNLMFNSSIVMVINVTIYFLYCLFDFVDNKKIDTIYHVITFMITIISGIILIIEAFKHPF